MLRKKAIVNGGLNLPDRNSQGPGLFNTGVFADMPVKRSKEKAPEREREEEEAKWADTNFAGIGDTKKKKREREKEKDKEREREREIEGGKDKKNGPRWPSRLSLVSGVICWHWSCYTTCANALPSHCGLHHPLHPRST